MLAWKTANSGQQPAGWEWIWEFESQGPGSTKVSVTYDWSAVKDKEVLKQVSIPVVQAHELETSLGNLAEAVLQV